MTNNEKIDFLKKQVELREAKVNEVETCKEEVENIKKVLQMKEQDLIALEEMKPKYDEEISQLNEIIATLEDLEKPVEVAEV